MRTAAARSHGRPLAPRAPRRVSGPVARPRPVARPAARPAPVAAPRQRAAALHRFVDRLLRGRAWIWLIGGALMGIVAMQVSLLKLNTGISRAVQSATTLERANARLEGRIAKLSSNERISRIALERGMVAPPAGAVVYVHARPDADAERAARRITPPSEEARALAANPPPVEPAAGEPPTTTTMAAPAATAEPAATPVPAPATGVAAAPTPGQG